MVHPCPEDAGRLRGSPGTSLRSLKMIPGTLGFLSSLRVPEPEKAG